MLGRSRGGQPPYAPVLMFKVLVLQTVDSQSDDVAWQAHEAPHYQKLLRDPTIEFDAVKSVSRHGLFPKA